MSREDLVKLFKLYRDAGIEPTPLIQSFGHMGWLFMNGQNKDLALRLNNNDQERLALEKSLENNKLENAALKVRLENNKKSQDSVAQASTRIKEVLNSHKERQRKVN